MSFRFVVAKADARQHPLFGNPISFSEGRLHLHDYDSELACFLSHKPQIMILLCFAGDLPMSSTKRPVRKHDTLVYRLSEVLTKLNQGEALDPQALADEFGVNLRTIQRDLNVRFAGLPLIKANG